MKKCLALMLALALSLTTAAAADEAVTVVAYADLTELVLAGSPDYLAAVREVRRQELALEDMQEQHTALLVNWQMASSAIISLQESMKAARKTLAAQQEALPDTARRQTVAAQKLYANHSVLLAEVESATRALGVAEANLALCREKLAWGYVTHSELERAEAALRTQVVAQEVARERVEENLRTLAKAVGLRGPIELGDLPPMDLAQIPLRDRAADKAAYVAASPAVRRAEEALTAAKEAYQKSESKENRYVRELAQLALDTARLDAAEAFDALYEALQKDYQAHLEEDTVAVAQRGWAHAEGQYALGLISGRTRRAAADALADAQGRELARRVGLWGRYLDYLCCLPLEREAAA